MVCRPAARGGSNPPTVEIRSDCNRAVKTSLRSRTITEDGSETCRDINASQTCAAASAADCNADSEARR
jgi:hypothetical protein